MQHWVERGVELSKGLRPNAMIGMESDEFDAFMAWMDEHFVSLPFSSPLRHPPMLLGRRVWRIPSTLGGKA